jgi:hypothetical protein
VGAEPIGVANVGRARILVVARALAAAKLAILATGLAAVLRFGVRAIGRGVAAEAIKTVVVRAVGFVGAIGPGAALTADAARAAERLVFTAFRRVLADAQLVADVERARLAVVATGRVGAERGSAPAGAAGARPGRSPGARSSCRSARSVAAVVRAVASRKFRTAARCDHRPRDQRHADETKPKPRWFHE